MSRIRLLALDLDGTLLRSDSSIDPRDLSAVRAASERGVSVVLATSRWPALSSQTAALLGLHAPQICHNGAEVLDEEGRTLRQLLMPADAAATVTAVTDAGPFETFTSTADCTYWRSGHALDARRLPPGVVVCGRHADVVQAGATAILVFGDAGVDAVNRALAGRFQGVLNVADGYSETFPHYLSVTAEGGDKGSALELVRAHLGVAAEETMAIGDAGPDVPMLRAAGVGVAMGNAPAHVKEAADAVTAGNLEAGVAAALERFVL